MAFRNWFSRKRAAQHDYMDEYTRLAMDLEPLTKVMQRLTLPGLKSDQIDDEDVKEAVNTIRYLNERLLDLSLKIHQLKNQNEQYEHRLEQGQFTATQTQGINQGHKQRIQPSGQLPHFNLGQGSSLIHQLPAGQDATADRARSVPNTSPNGRDHDRNRSE